MSTPTTMPIQSVTSPLVHRAIDQATAIVNELHRLCHRLEDRPDLCRDVALVETAAQELGALLVQLQDEQQP